MPTGLLISLCFFIVDYSVGKDKDKMMQHEMTTPHSGGSAEYLKALAEYNYWANTRFAEWLSNTPDSLMHLEIESSFPGLYVTLIHIWNAEEGWLRSLQGESWENLPGNSFEGEAAAMFQGFLTTSADFRDHVIQMTSKDLNKPISEDSPGITRGDVIIHVVNHSTYHRGQLITIGRQAGLTNMPRTDYIHYIRQFSTKP